MRTHSRLDFYAKVITLAGLGCLAAAGALMDSWPSAGRLPDVPSILQPKPTPFVLTVVDVSGFTSAAPMGLSISLAAAVAPAPARRARRAPASHDSAAAPQDVSRPAPPPSMALAARVTPFALPAELHARLAVPPPAEAPPPPVASWAFTRDLPLIPVGETAFARSHIEDDGFFPGILKRTGSSVSSSVGSSIGKAGSSLVGAFRFVGDAVRRAF